MRFSIAPDLSLMRNFSPKQKFWSLGQTVQGNFHFSKKETGYAWLTFFTPGKFKNNFTAVAKSSGTVPASIPFKATARWRNNQVSLGWKHYFRGSFDAGNDWNFYSTAGFGLMFTKVENLFQPGIDTALYSTPVLPGANEFKRLTIDLGLGMEYPIGGDFFLYGDARTWIPTTRYPSPYLHNNKNVPLPFIMAFGLRILFGY
jgi:hypothetical protein